MKRRSTTLVILRLLVFFMAVCDRASYSFEEEEHRSMGNKAFLIAMDMNNIDCNVNQNFTLCELLDDGENNKPTYGSIVESVDFVLDPSVMFAQIGENSSYPKNIGELNPSIFGKYANPKLNYLRSSHVNDAHFQAQLLFNLHDWHKRSINIAKNENALFSAIVTNAVSDHYLHDFFAPGHIGTPRYNFHDTFSLGMHDDINRLGAIFAIKNWDELEPILKFIERDPKKYGFSESVIDGLASKHDFINLHGDDELKNSPIQELFVVLVEVYSISEVISCGIKSECNRTVFDRYSWKTTTVSDRTLRSPLAGIYFGDYKLPVKNVLVYSPVVGVSFGHETVFVEDGQDRFGFTIETVPLGIPGSPDFVREPDNRPLYAINFAPSIGYSWIESEAYFAKGPMGRLIWAFPQVDTQFSVYSRWLTYESDDFSIRKNSYGIRGDVGFSMITGYFCVGSDYAFNSEGFLESAPQITFGLTMSWPLSRVPIVKDAAFWVTGKGGVQLPYN